MPTRICADPTCPSPAVYRGRCQTHARQRNRETRSPNHAIYNRAKWANTRKRYLAEHPMCEICDNEIATDVHHRTDLQAGGDPWATENLQACCHAHHSQITRRRQTEGA